MRRNGTLVLGMAVALLIGSAPAISQTGTKRPVIRKEELSERVFTRAPDTNMVKQGSAEKYLFIDDTGTLWLFKPMPSPAAYVEEAAWRLAARCGLAAAEVYSVSVKDPEGQPVTGTLGRILDDIDGRIDRCLPESLTREQVAQLQALQVFRWLIADFDTHAGNFLVDKRGNVVTIDHSMSFADETFFEFDLDSDHPYRSYSFYAPFFKANVEGRMALDAARPFAFIEGVRRIPDATLEAIVRPYAVLRQKAEGCALRNRRGQVVCASDTEFVACVLGRFHRVRDDFEKFYGRLAARRGEGSFKAPAAGSMAPWPVADESLDRWTVSAEPLPLRFTDSEDTFAKETRAQRQKGHFMKKLGSMDLQKTIRFARFFVSCNVQSVKDFMNRQAIAEVSALDLKTLALDDAFKETLEKLPADVLRGLKERASFAVNHPEAPPEVRKNGETLGLWVDQVKAARNRRGFGLNPAAP